VREERFHERYPAIGRRVTSPNYVVRGRKSGIIARTVVHFDSTSGAPMTKKFSFADGDRKYTCHIEGLAGRPEAWWWFEVSGDTHRYAPFQAARGDTEASVRERIVAYYQNMLIRRAEPARSWHNRGQPRPAAAATTPTEGNGTPA
jgi:hypothetical protein